MADDVQFPGQRLEYVSTNLGNPRFVSDIVAANQFVYDAMIALGNFGSSDFWILSGLVYTPGSPGNYTAGVFYFNGVFYYQPSTFNEGSYLHPNVTQILPITFPDSITRNIYQVNYSLANTTSSGGTPEFSGNMNAYRLSLKVLNTNLTPVLAVNEQQAHLGTGYVVSFTNDKNVFFADALSNATITFNLTGAIQDCVVTLKWTFAGSQTLTVTAPGGGTVIQEGGDLGLAANNTNIMNIMFVGLNEAGNQEIRYVLNQSL